MGPNSKQLFLPTALVVIGMALVVALSLQLEKFRPELPDDYYDSDLAVQGKKLKGYSLGAEGLIADWYWMLSLQYLGGKIVESKEETIRIDNLTSLNPRLLYPYLENATELDPKFNAAYSFGAVVLPAIDTQKAIELTEKGIRNNPESWRLYQYLGYIHWKQKDYRSAAATYEEGSRIPGAPPFMRQMVAAMNAAGGSRETARAIYSQMLSESEDEQSKANAQIRLLELDAMEEMDAVNNALVSYRDRTGRCAERIAEIFPVLKDLRLPAGNDFEIDPKGNLVDPSGVVYVFDRNKCTISLANESSIPRPLN